MPPTDLRPATTYPAVVGAVLSRLRLSLDLSQAEFAMQVGVDQSTWSRVERGRSSLSLELLARAARVLDRRPGSILRRADRVAKALTGRGVEVAPGRAGRARGEGRIAIDFGALGAVVDEVLAADKG